MASAGALRPRSRSLAELILLGKGLDVAPVEQLDPHVRAQLPQPAQLAVLLGHERLLHGGDLEVDILLGQVEVVSECLERVAVLVEVEGEGMRLVFPGNAVVGEDLRTLELGLVGEGRRRVARVGVEPRLFLHSAWKLYFAGRTARSMIATL